MRSIVSRVAVLGLVVLLGSSTVSYATVVVYAVPSATTVNVGDSVDVQLLADLGEPVVAWGLGLSFDRAILSETAAATGGPAWETVFETGNDALMGLAFPDSISGNSVLLATFHFEAVSTGQAWLTPTITPGDLTQGFALDPAGFAIVQFAPAVMINVVPEPMMSLGLLAIGSLVILRRRGLRPF
ncbi:MAG: PEP-CTERM sorting domain-containing protein [Phycisphaerae bacterium]|nr:PEP-CTERM sorting domain-containing protein [Phycisphaerae bacterium]